MNFPSDFDDAVNAGFCVVGSPSTVRDRLLPQVEMAGINYLLGRLAFGNLALERSLRSVELLEEEVLPRPGRRERSANWLARTARVCNSNAPTRRRRDRLAIGSVRRVTQLAWVLRRQPARRPYRHLKHECKDPLSAVAGCVTTAGTGAWDLETHHIGDALGAREYSPWMGLPPVGKVCLGQQAMPPDGRPRAAAVQDPGGV